MPELSVSQCLAHVTHTLGSAKVPSIGGLRILNDAGEYLCSYYPWAWLQGRRVTLDFELGQDHVWLPDDFQEVTGLNATNSITSAIRPTSMQHLIDLRTQSITTTNWVYWYAIAHSPRFERATGSITFTDVPDDDSTITIDDGVNPAVTFTMDVDGSGTGTVAVDLSESGITASGVAAALQDAIVAQMEAGNLAVDSTVDGAVVSLTSRVAGTQGNETITDSGTTNATLSGMSGGVDGGAPRARLEIWPDPLVDDAGALTLYYRAGWETLDEDSDFVSIPEWIQGLYIQLIRAFARGYEREDVASMSQRCMEVMMGPFAMSAKRRDGMMQPAYGEMHNSAADMSEAGLGYSIRYNAVADPS